MKDVLRQRSLANIIRKIEKKLSLSKFDGVNVHKFDEVSINVNLKCNLNCVMCHQGEIKHLKDMGYELFKKILIRLKSYGVKKIALIGGEVFLLKDLWKFIELMERMKFKYDISSNLYNINNLERLKRLKGLEIINTSLDGLELTHNKIRRNPNAFQNTVSNIKKLIRMGLKVNVACVVQKANFDELEKLTLFLIKLGIKNISFLVENKVSKDEKNKSIEEIHNITNKTPEFFVSTIKNPLGVLSKEEISMLGKKMRVIQNISKKYKIKVNFAEQFRNPSIMDQKAELKGYTCSLFPGYDSYVHIDGSFNTCPFVKFSGDEFNLSKNHPLKILNSEEYRAIRKKFKHKGATSKCKYCCAIVKK